jgi:hypothetical protein
MAPSFGILEHEGVPSIQQDALPVIDRDILAASIDKAIRLGPSLDIGGPARVPDRESMPGTS